MCLLQHLTLYSRLHQGSRLKMTFNLSVWLLPSQSSPEFAAFSALIANLATGFDRHPYAPHVTLSMLPYEFPLSIVDRLLDEMKDDIFQEYVDFDHLFTTDKGIVVHGREGTRLKELQKLWHTRLDEELKHDIKEGKLSQDKLSEKGVSIDVKNIVPWFPHFAIAYADFGQQQAVEELERQGIYKHNSTEAGNTMELSGYSGFKVGSIWLANCGGLRVEKWKVFKKIDINDEMSSSGTSHGPREEL